MHWASQFIGKTEAEVNHCWGLLRMAYQLRFGISLPELPNVASDTVRAINATINGEICKEWEEVESPFDGCAVGMSQSEALHHVGIYIDADGGKIVHCWGGSNVIADSLKSLKIRGFKIIKFYRHRLWPI